MRLATGSDDVADEPLSYKPPLHHLRRFGCVAYKLIPKQQRVDAKMGARSKKCMMFGYVHNTTKVWKLWDPEQIKSHNARTSSSKTRQISTQWSAQQMKKMCSVFRRKPFILKTESHFH